MSFQYLLFSFTKLSYLLIAAHESLKSAIRVGRYGVNLNDLNGIAVPSMIPSNVEQVVIIDEIGKMECFSKLF
jgi:nucleoside-triphosphatase